MSEDIQDNQDATENTSAVTEKTEYQKRIDNLVAQKNAAQSELETLKAEQRQKEAEALAKQGEYKQLYESTLAEIEPLRQAKQELEAQRARLEQRNKDRLALIPEDKRGLIPDIDDALKMEAWLDRSLALITEQQKPTAPRGDGGARGNANQTPLKLTAQELEFAKLAGMSPERYAEQKARRGESIDLNKK